jgi:hypothetical protein
MLPQHFSKISWTACLAFYVGDEDLNLGGQVLTASTLFLSHFHTPNIYSCIVLPYIVTSSELTLIIFLVSLLFQGIVIDNSKDKACLANTALHDFKH